MIACAKLLECLPARSEGPAFVFFEGFNGIAAFHCAYQSSEPNMKWQAWEGKSELGPDLHEMHYYFLLFPLWY